MHVTHSSSVLIRYSTAVHRVRVGRLQVRHIMKTLSIACFLFITAHANPAGTRKGARSSDGQELHNSAGLLPTGDKPAIFNLNGPVTDQDSARVEKTFKDHRPYDAIQNTLIGVFHPKPIVDTIEEHEKYGNDGSRHTAIGTAVVRGSETISKFINGAIDTPKAVLQKVSRGATDVLNQLGAKLIGL